MYLFKDIYGNYCLRFRKQEWKLTAKTAQSAMLYVGLHLDTIMRKSK